METHLPLARQGRADHRRRQARRRGDRPPLHAAGASLDACTTASSRRRGARCCRPNSNAIARRLGRADPGRPARRRAACPPLVEPDARHASAGLDVLVNNASTFFPTPVGDDHARRHWDDLVGTNLRAPLFLSQAAAPALRKRAGRDRQHHRHPRRAPAEGLRRLLGREGGPRRAHPLARARARARGARQRASHPARSCGPRTAQFDELLAAAHRLAHAAQARGLARRHRARRRTSCSPTRPTSPARRSPSTAAATWRSDAPARCVRWPPGCPARPPPSCRRRCGRSPASSACSPATTCCGRSATRWRSRSVRRGCTSSSRRCSSRCSPSRRCSAGSPGRFPRKRLLPWLYALLRRQPDRLLRDLRGRRHAGRRRSPARSSSGCRVFNLFARQRVLEPDGRPVRHRAGASASTASSPRAAPPGRSPAFADRAVRDAGRREGHAARVGRASCASPSSAVTRLRDWARAPEAGGPRRSRSPAAAGRGSPTSRAARIRSASASSCSPTRCCRRSSTRQAALVPAAIADSARAHAPARAGRLRGERADAGHAGVRVRGADPQARHYASCSARCPSCRSSASSRSRSRRGSRRWSRSASCAAPASTRCRSPRARRSSPTCRCPSRSTRRKNVIDTLVHRFGDTSST
ncbi:MAG: hypothetical protein MZW92_32950 [Comamonadaceae bacterium]|nr:hypothetical protein [Comamonadaceae bacterium]